MKLRQGSRGWEEDRMTKENRIRGGEVPTESTSEGASYSACTMKDLVSKVPSEEHFELLGILFHPASPSAA